MNPVLVTTNNRGVYFGYLEDDSEAPAKHVLTNARCAVYWDTDILKGFLELAADGPSGACRISRPTTRFTVYGVATVAECTDKAADAWELAPWG